MRSRSLILAIILSLSACATAPRASGSAGFPALPTLGEFMHGMTFASVNLVRVAGALDWMWTNTVGIEWHGCLQGRIEGDTLFVTGIELGRMRRASANYVESSCRLSPTTVGTIHPHFPQYPPVPCVPSEGDIKQFDSENSKVYAFNIIQCDQYTYYVDQTYIQFANLPSRDSARASLQALFELDKKRGTH